MFDDVSAHPAPHIVCPVGWHACVPVGGGQEHVGAQVNPEHVPPHETMLHVGLGMHDITHVPPQLAAHVLAQVLPVHVAVQVRPLHVVPCVGLGHAGPQVVPVHVLPQVLPLHVLVQVAPVHVLPQVLPLHVLPVHVLPVQVFPEHVAPEQVVPLHVAPTHVAPLLVAPPTEPHDHLKVARATIERRLEAMRSNPGSNLASYFTLTVTGPPCTRWFNGGSMVISACW